MKKEYDRAKVIQALLIIISDYSKNGWIKDEDFVINKIKSSLELILLGISINKANNLKTYISQIKKVDKNLATIFTNELR